MPKYVLTGVGGNIGGIAASYALEIAQKDTVLSFTSSDLDKIPAHTLEEWKTKGVTVSAASYDDIDSLIRVFHGADAVAFISTWAFGRRPQQAQNVIDAAKACGVRRICYTSFVGADDPAPVHAMPFLPRDHKQTEALIRASGLEYNIQRNCLYLDNIPTLFAPSWNFCGGRWLSNSHHVPGAYVAREDCGRVLAALLLGRGEPNKVYQVTGPEAVTDEQILHSICENLAGDDKIQFVDLPDEELKDYWVRRGLPTDVGEVSKLPMKLCVDDLLCCGEMVAKGYMAKTSNAVEILTGRKPLSVQDVLNKYQGLLREVL
ncbi:hypothetical protein ASPZODRAFT_77035 [Penicilliopsis zonata CBS 506.65]|uniref:NAD(P)-binding domain-containing protein n=1 Tax=Penicilliopsis zonata CBS 506.65 TaxID=1073090 RepID=A0A1L9S5A5_9EURO|nr:hypothetical protein ASPZODRAFT_77035 [Penicilliopsis zonata CBS 506.65]OJJ42346.1 hypothetical protein ASPZODRAFT_77035 [Penicilliopsis zonata CBS 506.65]